MSELPPSDWPFRVPPARLSVPEDQAFDSFAAMDRDSESAPTLSQVLPCQQPYVEISFFDEKPGRPVEGGALNIRFGGVAEERALDGQASYRIDGAAKDIDALIGVVSAEPKNGGTEWRVDIGDNLTSMKGRRMRRPPSTAPRPETPI